MKKLLIIAALLFASVQLRASHRASELNLRMFDFSLITVRIDQFDFTTPVEKFNFDRLTPGSHFITVTRFSDGTVGHYVQPYVIFSGYVDIPFASRVNASIDRQFRFRINKVIPLAPAPVVYQPAFQQNICEPVVFGMNDFDFRHLVTTINRMSFESSRVQIAKQALATNVFTARQVSELLSLMTFESTKLDLAKFAYQRTVDKQNYFIVNDAFTFESSIRDLNEFIYRS